MIKILIFILKVYKNLVSPVGERLFGKGCRFTPTCSEYTIQALEKFGFVKGVSLGVMRIGKCHPWGKFGYDPVPRF